jgi:hypothetical protein
MRRAALAAVCFCRWLYKSAVTRSSEWPSNIETSTSSTPSAISRLDETKFGTITVVTHELALASGSDGVILNAITQDALTTAALRENEHLLSALAAVPGVSPAGLLYGVTGLSAEWGDDPEADTGQLIRSVRSAVRVSREGASILGTMRNSDGARIFPNISVRGGDILGVPVIISVAAESTLILIDAASIAYADGGVEIDRSSQAAIQMLDNPTNSTATGTATNIVSLFQTGAIGLKTVRYVNWLKAHADAVAYIELPTGSLPSP